MPTRIEARPVPLRLPRFAGWLARWQRRPRKATLDGLSDRLLRDLGLAPRDPAVRKAELPRPRWPF